MGKLIAYALEDYPLLLRPAPSQHLWMDETPDSYAYRCLPLTMANSYGWEMLCPVGFSAIWDGSIAQSGIMTRPDYPSSIVASHFGSGILTFQPPALFRTDPGYDLMVMGPINSPKANIYPLSGLVETDWSPYTFTMNWKFLVPHQEIRFEQGEPFCHFFPVKRGELENVNPEIIHISKNPDLQEEHASWAESRALFNKHVFVDPNSVAAQEGWTRDYYRGLRPDKETKAPEHKTKVRLKAFREG